MSEAITLIQLLDLCDESQEVMVFILCVSSVKGNADTLKCMLARNVLNSRVATIETEEEAIKIWIDDENSDD